MLPRQTVPRRRQQSQERITQRAGIILLQRQRNLSYLGHPRLPNYTHQPNQAPSRPYLHPRAPPRPSINPRPFSPHPLKPSQRPKAPLRRSQVPYLDRGGCQRAIPSLKTRRSVSLHHPEQESRSTMPTPIPTLAVRLIPLVPLPLPPPRPRPTHHR